MSDRCEPPEELRGVDGWHWLTEHNPVLWIADRQEWEWGEDDWVTPDAAYRYGYRYLAPVTTPAIVRALVEALEPFASATILPTGAVVGLERGWFDAARAALASAKAEGL